MIKTRYIVAAAAFIVLISFYFLLIKKEKTLPEPVEERQIAEKVYTKMDSLIFSYDSLLSHRIDSVGLVGAAIVITYKGEIVHLKCYGVKEAGGTDSINENTIFRLASVSKTITGVLAGIMDSENIIGLDDKVIDYLPGFKLKDSINTYDLSIRNILSHTSGLVPHAYDNMVEAQVPFHIIIDSLQRVNIGAEPGKLYGYQNVVFSLYDTISQVKTSESFEQLLKEKVFMPFGMETASAGFASFAANTNKALPHSQNKVLPLNDRYYLTNPAAGINASISDMGHFLIALSGHDSTILNPHITETVLTPQVKSPLRWVYLRRWDVVDSKNYAVGWRIIGYKGRQIAYHGGFVQGYRAEIAICPEEDIGIAFLSNSPGSIGSYCVPTFLDLYFQEFQNKTPVK